MGFRTSDAQRNVMGQSTVRCQHLFLCFLLYATRLRMYDVEKCTAVLENVAGFAR